MSRSRYPDLYAAIHLSFGSGASDGRLLDVDRGWGSYVQLDTATCTMPTWIFSREYPWNLIDDRILDDSGNLVLPQYVIDRL